MAGPALATALAVGAVGTILLLGVFLTLFSKQKAYPLTLLLLLFGIFVGPIGKLFDPNKSIGIISPFVTLALIMVLFDAGYGTKLYTLSKSFKKPLIFGTLTVFITTLLIAVPFKFFLNLSWHLAVLFGALLASTDLTIIAPMLNALNLKPKIKEYLEIESTVNSILSAVIVIIIINLLSVEKSSGINILVLDSIKTLLYNIFVGVGIGLLAGYLILKLTERLTLEEKPHIIVIGALFVAFALSEYLGASGIATALSIGIIFGNSKVHLPRIIKSFGGEMELILVTFVYVILGAILDFGIIWKSILLAVILILLIYISRYIGFRLSHSKDFKDVKNMIILSSPRGIVCAVLTLSYAQMFANPEQIIGLVFAVILVSAVLVFGIPKSLPKTAFSKIKTRG